MTSAYQLLSAILSEPWAIDPAAAESYFPLVDALLRGDQDFKAASSDPFEAMKDRVEMVGDVAVVKMEGVMLRDDPFCGTGCLERAELIQNLSADNKVAAVVLKINSPGGQVNGLEQLSAAIRGSSKPVVAFCNAGLIASAAYWVACSATEVYTSSKSDRVGSIGAFITVLDLQKRYEMMGVKPIEVYAPQSTEKNQPIRDLLKTGDETAIKAELAQLVNQFVAHVKEMRGEKLNAQAGDPFKGKTYFAAEAQAIGLTDGTLTLSQAIERARELATTKSRSNDSNSTTTQTKTIMLESKETKQAKALYAAISATQEESADKAATIKAVNAMLAAQGFEGVELRDSAATEQAAATAEQLATAQQEATDARQQLAAAQEELTTTKTSLQAAEKARDEFKAKAEEYGAKAGAAATNPVRTEKEETPNASGQGEPDFSNTDWDQQASKLVDSQQS